MSEEKKEKKTSQSVHRVYQLIASLVGIMATWALNTQLGIDAVLASAVVSLCGGILVKKYHGLVMTASFAGMSSLVAIPTWYFAMLVGIVVFIIWVVLEKKFFGVGGKFGMMGCISTFLSQFIIIPMAIAMKIAVAGVPITAARWNTLLINTSLWSAWFVGSGELGINIYLCVILTCLGAVLCIWLRNHVVTPLFKAENATIASALTGIIGFIFFWGIIGTLKINLSPLNAAEAAKLGAFVYMGSFAGMAVKKRVRWEGKGDIIPFAITGAFAGLFFLVTRMILPYGGIYGLTAFLAVLFYENVFSRLILRQKKEEVTIPPSFLNK